MDIMRPKLTQIGNMCFRRLDITSDPTDSDITVYYKDNSIDTENDSKVLKVIENKTVCHNNQSIDNKSQSIDQLDEVLIDSEDEAIQQINGQNGKRFKIELKIAQQFHGFILGKSAVTKRRIENETNTRIVVPKQTDLKSPVVITGDTRSAVKSAKGRLDSIVDYWRLKLDFSHFVSIPCNDAAIRHRFTEFKNQVLNDSECISKGINESLFQSSNKLHLTIALLLLCDENERSIASQILEDCDRSFIKELTQNKPIPVRIEGIDYMNDDPTQVDVVYAKIVDLSEKQCLQTIINQIFSRFEESKLMTGSHAFDRVSDKCKVKPHITLLNSKFRQRSAKPERDGRSRDEPKRSTFDATPIISRFGNYSFGEFSIETIDISIRHSNGRGKDGYYSHTYSITL